MLLNTHYLNITINDSYYLHCDIPTSLTVGHDTRYCIIEELQGNFCPKMFTVED